jgi:hypothetical protein
MAVDMMSRILWLSALLAASCDGRVGPLTVGDPCSSASDECAAGLTCEIDRCVGTAEIHGEIGSLFPDALGELVVFVLPNDAPSLDPACDPIVRSAPILVDAYPVSYSVEQVPPGTFIIYAELPDPERAGRSFLAFRRVSVRVDGMVFDENGLRLGDVNLALTAMGPDGCGSD